MSTNLGTLEAYLGLNTSGLTSGLASAQKSMQNAGRAMQRVGRTMTLAISLPLKLVGIASTKMASDFQQSMRRINTLVGLSSDRVNMMTKDVMKLSNVTGKSAKELADALFVITSAGQRGAESLEILEASSKSAAIGLGLTKDIARTVTSVLNAYGKENITAAQAADQLVAVVREGNLEASELAPVLGRVLGVASQLGISFAEVGASVATFTRIGVDSAEAITGLRGIMNALLKPSEQGREALAGLGKTFASLRQEIREKGLAVSLIEIIQAFDGNVEAISDLVPNVRALATMLGTAGAQSKTYADITKKVAGAVGLVNDGFQAISQDSGFKFQQTLTRLKNAGMQMGLILLPTLIKILNKVSALFLKFQNLSTQTKKYVLVIAGIAAAIGPALIALGTLAVVIGSINLPIIAAVASIAALGAAFIWLTNNLDAVKERLNNWSIWWKITVLKMTAVFTNFISSIIKGLNWLGERAGRDPIPNPFEAMTKGLEELSDITGLYKTKFTSLTDSIKNAADKAKKALLGLFSVGGGAILPGEGAPTRVLTPDKLKTPGGVGLPDALPDKLEKVRVGVSAVTSEIVDLGTAMQNVLNTAISDFAEILGDVFTGDAGATGFFSNMLAIVSSFMKQLGKAIIAAGVAMLALQSLFANPFAAIAAGIALVAASRVVTNIAKKGPQGLRSGGFVTDGGVFQLHKDELVTLPNGSAVTPANMAQGSQVIKVIGYLEGDGETLRAVIKEAERRNVSIN